MLRSRFTRVATVVAVVALSGVGVSLREADVAASPSAAEPGAAQVAASYIGLTPARIMDTRINLGAEGPVRAKDPVTLQATGVGGVPGMGVGAVVLNVTATNPTAATYITVWPTGQPKPTASNLNVVAGQSVPNLVIATVGLFGMVSFYNFAGTVDLIADVAGWYPTGADYTGLTPARIMDTRSSVGAAGPVLAGVPVNLKVTGVGGVPATGVAAVVLNVTATNPTAATYITVWPTGQPRPTASNLNVVADQSVPNLVIATLGTDGQVSFYNNTGTVDLIADVAGWYPVGADYTGLTPARIMDTRTNVGAAGPVLAGTPVDLNVTGVGGVPATGVGAVVLNVTATNPTAATYITVWPTGQPRPTASNLNVVADQSVPNLVIATVGANGQVSFYNNTGTVDLIADVAGWYPVGQTSGIDIAEADAVCADALSGLKELPKPFVDPDYDLGMWAYGASIILHYAEGAMKAAGPEQLGAAIGRLAEAYGDLAVADDQGKFNVDPELRAIDDALAEVKTIATGLGSPTCVELGAGNW